MAETDSSGALAQTHHQDAFGNTQASWSTGLWGGDKPGWHHNTKEYDGDIGLVYMYSRYYNAETGTFGSRAPYPPMVEHPYQFALAMPTYFTDPVGEFVWCTTSVSGTCCCSVFGNCWGSGCSTPPPPPPTPPRRRAASAQDLRGLSKCIKYSSKIASKLGGSKTGYPGAAVTVVNELACKPGEQACDALAGFAEELEKRRKQDDDDMAWIK